MPPTSKLKVIKMASPTTSRWSAEGRCRDCGSSDTNGKARCPEHLTRGRQSANKLNQKRRGQGLCYCGNPPVVGLSCEVCWFRNIAKLRTGSAKRASTIKAILEKQKYRCAYTGEGLLIGVNASLDHKTPTSRGGRKDDPSNLQWVSERINRMKTDFTHDEFISTCGQIYQSQIP
jgi:hypothetical protein